MRIEKFEDVIAWQKAKQLTLALYDIFENSRDFSFRDQIQRASISIMNNIAEGFDRGTDKEFVYFLYIARGSSAEVRSMLYVAVERDYINQQQQQDLVLVTQDISKLLTGFIKTLKPKDGGRTTNL